MKLKGFPNCCTASILYDFGGTNTSGMRTRKVTTLRTELEDFVKSFSDDLLVAVINSEQKDAAKLLDEFGFDHTTWMKKDIHHNTKLRVYWRKPDTTVYQTWQQPNK